MNLGGDWDGYQLEVKGGVRHRSCLSEALIITTPLPSTCCNGQQIKAGIDKIQFPDDGHLVLLKFHLHKWFGCHVALKVDSKNMCPKGMYDFKKQKVPGTEFKPTTFCL